jgi:hypothetical protein
LETISTYEMRFWKPRSCDHAAAEKTRIDQEGLIIDCLEGIAG